MRSLRRAAAPGNCRASLWLWRLITSLAIIVHSQMHSHTQTRSRAPPRPKTHARKPRRRQEGSSRGVEVPKGAMIAPVVLRAGPPSRPSARHLVRIRSRRTLSLFLARSLSPSPHLLPPQLS
ncbi:hypothetical protein DENSPDRAFT_934770, partial [Dentipellis sp. KUC8613]